MSVNLTPVLIGGVNVMAKAINAVATDPGCYHDVWVSNVDQGFEYSQEQPFVVIGLSKTNPREAGYSFKNQGATFDYSVELGLRDIELFYLAAKRRDGGIAGMWGAKIGIVVDPKDGYTVIAICQPRKAG